MKTPGFVQGVGLALLLSVAGSALFALFTRLMDTDTALRMVISLSTAAYLLFLLHESTARVGKVTTVIFCIATGALCWLFDPGLAGYLLIHLGLLWLVRCLYFQRSPLAAMLDLGLQGLSMAAALWALQETGSLLLCLWSFFLVQAAFVAIPHNGFGCTRDAPPGVSYTAAFARSHRSAEAALRRLV